MTNLNKILAFILLALVSLIPVTLVFGQEYVDPFFTADTMPRLILALDTGEPLASFNIPGFGFDPQYSNLYNLQFIIAKICGLSAYQVQFLPVGAIILALLYFVLTKKLFGSSLIAGFIALWVIYDPSIMGKSSSTYVFTWVYPLYMSFIILWVRILKEEAKRKEMLLLVLLFVSAFFFYWGLPPWMLVLSVFISAILLIGILIGKQEALRNKAIFNLTLVFIIIYFAWDTVLYQSYLPQVLRSGNLELAWDNFSVILESIGLITASPTEPYLSSPLQSPLLYRLLSIRYVLIVLPVVTYILVKLKELIAAKRLKLSNIDVHSIVIWSFIGLSLWHIVSYAAFGGITLVMVLRFFPFVGIACLVKLKARSWLKVAFPIILAMLALVTFGIYLNETTPQIRYSDVTPSSGWLADNSGQQTKILGDFITTSKYVMNGASHKVMFQHHWMNSTNYAHLIEADLVLTRNDYLKARYDFVVINKKFAHSSLWGEHWQFYEPLANYFDELINNVNIDKVYNDGIIWIFRTR